MNGSSAAVLAQAETKLTRLAAENARLKHEAEAMRQRLRPSRAERIIAQAHEDARLILHYRHADIPATRRTLEEMGIMTQSRFTWAYGLLKRARIADVAPTDVQHLDACLRRLAGTVATLERMRKADAMMELRARAGRAKLRNVYRRFD